MPPKPKKNFFFSLRIITLPVLEIPFVSSKKSLLHVSLFFAVASETDFIFKQNCVSGEAFLKEIRSNRRLYFRTCTLTKFQFCQSTVSFNFLYVYVSVFRRQLIFFFEYRDHHIIYFASTNIYFDAAYIHDYLITVGLLSLDFTFLIFRLFPLFSFLFPFHHLAASQPVRDPHWLAYRP